MEGHDVAESTVKLLVGHPRGSMAFAHCSKGERVDLRAAIDHLDYVRRFSRSSYPILRFKQ